MTTAGSLNIQTQAGNLTLSDLDGAEILRSGNSSGDILLRVATAVGAILGINVDRDAVIAPAGSIDIVAGTSILLGTAGPAVSNDIRAAGSVDLLAGSTMIIDGSSRVASDEFGTSSAGNLTARAFTQLEVRGTAAMGAGGSAGADAFALTGGNGALNLLAANRATPAEGVTWSQREEARNHVLGVGHGIAGDHDDEGQAADQSTRRVSRTDPPHGCGLRVRKTRTG